MHLTPMAEFNTSRRAPMVFVLDATGSMLFSHQGKTRMDLLNMVVEYFIENLILDAKVRGALEVAFVVFNDEILLTTDFMSLEEIEAGKFTTSHERYQGCVTIQKRTVTDPRCGAAYRVQIPKFQVSKKDNGTKIGAAVLKGMEMLEQRAKIRRNSNSGCYPPFLVLITDGHPQSKDGARYQDELQKKAVAAVRSHCSTNGDPANLIIPFVIGVGDDIGKETLTQYSGEMVDGFFHVPDIIGTELMRIVAELICTSISKSMSLATLSLKKKVQKEHDRYEKIRQRLLYQI